MEIEICSIDNLEWSSGRCVNTKAEYKEDEMATKKLIVVGELQLMHDNITSIGAVDKPSDLSTANNIRSNISFSHTQASAVIPYNIVDEDDKFDPDFISESNAKPPTLRWELPSSQHLRVGEGVGASKVNIYFLNVDNDDRQSETNRYSVDNAIGWAMIDICSLLESQRSEPVNLQTKVYGCGSRCVMKVNLRLINDKQLSIASNQTESKDEVAILSMENYNDMDYHTNLKEMTSDRGQETYESIECHPRGLPLPHSRNFIEFDKSTRTFLPIGSGSNLFKLKIKLECAFNLHLLDSAVSMADKNGAWLSYSCFDEIFQTDRFFSLKHAEFSPLVHEHLLQSSTDELQAYLLQSPPLIIHLCANQKVLGSALVSLNSLASRSDSNFKKISNYYIVSESRNTISDIVNLGSCEPCIGLTITLEKEAPLKKSNDSSDEEELELCKDNTKTRSDLNRHCSLDFSCKKDNTQFEHWELWRHEQELKWHESLREKETAIMKIVEEKAHEKEKEMMQSMKAIQLEYGRLEQRLKTSLADVENKERVLLANDSKRQSEYAQKVLDLQIQQRRSKDEANHLIKLEKSKISVLEERIGSLERSLQVSEKKAKDADEKLCEMKKQYRESTEGHLMQEICLLKGKLSESEKNVLKERSEKNQVLVEIERYKGKMASMAKSLHREREKKLSHERQEAEKLRLDYFAREQRYSLAGDRNKLKLLKEELCSLNFSSLNNIEKNQMTSSLNPFKPTNHIEKNSDTDLHDHKKDPVKTN